MRWEISNFNSVVLCLLTFAVTGSRVDAQDPQLRFGSAIPADVELMYGRGLEWLAQNQSPEGTWAEGDPGPGITGMAVMAFLAGGDDPNFGPYSDNIRRAVRRMILTQDSETGYLGGRSGQSSMYHHGFAMLGLSEVYGVLDESTLWDAGTPVARRRSIAQALELAVRASVTAQKNNPFHAWRYGPEASDADTSVSGAVLMGLLAARNAGIEVPDESIDQALEYFRSMTTKRGDVGYSGIGGGGSQNLKAIAGLVYAVGRRKDLPEYMAVLGQLTVNLEHDEVGYPEYFRYYNAQALFQGDIDAWAKWNQLTITRLKDLQAADGSFDGTHGRGYATSMSLLALALNYRLLPIYER